MIKQLLSIVAISAASLSLYAQTSGSLTFTFTTIAHTGYSGTKNVLAVWIQNSSGQFIKTKLRYAGNGTNDHLPTWAVNSGGSANNCLAASCNISSATTGSTLSGATTKTITWDGTNTSGTVVPDGTYKVAIQETWNHGTSGTTTRYITFVKGPSADVQSPTADANFTGMSLAWNPSAAGIEETTSNTGVKVYPNPSTTGVFTIEFDNADKVRVLNVLGVEVLEEKIASGENKKSIDLSRFSNGVYFISLTDGNKTTEHRVVINK